MAQEIILSMTDAEKSDLVKLEQRIVKGMAVVIDVALALREIKDRLLYRDGYPSWSAYCEGRWGKSRDWGYNLISWINSLELIQPHLPPEIPPPTERESRELTPLRDEPAKMGVCIVHATDDSKAQGKKRTAKHVKKRVKEMIGEDGYGTDAPDIDQDDKPAKPLSEPGSEPAPSDDDFEQDATCVVTLGGKAAQWGHSGTMTAVEFCKLVEDITADMQLNSEEHYSITLTVV